MTFSEGQLFLHPAVQQKSLLFFLDVCVCVCVCFFFFCSAMAVRIRAFQASFTVGEILWDEPNLVS